MDLKRVERELKKRLLYPYKWGRKQSNDWDYKTNFIYKTYSFERLLQKTSPLTPDLKNYALNRWYNFWSAMAVEYIFNSHSNVTSKKNVYDKFVDFFIYDVPFDHKTSVFPQGFGNNFQYAMKHKTELIEWLYKNQSQQGRKHLKNRIFLVLFDKNQEHWKLKSEIFLLKSEIDKYVKNFDRHQLLKFNFGQGKVCSDIIWITKS